MDSLKLFTLFLVMTISFSLVTSAKQKPYTIISNILNNNKKDLTNQGEILKTILLEALETDDEMSKTLKRIIVDEIIKKSFHAADAGHILNTNKAEEKDEMIADDQLKKKKEIYTEKDPVVRYYG